MTYVTIQEKFWLELFEYNKLIIKLVTRTNKEKESNLRNKLVFGLAFFCSTTLVFISFSIILVLNRRLFLGGDWSKT